MHPRPAAPAFEQLEVRRLLAATVGLVDGILTIQGTAGGNNITLSERLSTVIENTGPFVRFIDVSVEEPKTEYLLRWDHK